MKNVSNPERYRVRHTTGTAFHVDTPIEVIKVVDQVIKSEARVRIFYGDRNTGYDYGRRFNILGYIGRTNGGLRVPILLSRSDSTGGHQLDTEEIVKIVSTATGETLYAHPNYHTGDYWTSTNADGRCEVYRDGSVVGRYDSRVKAMRFVDFILGLRHSP